MIWVDVVLAHASRRCMACATRTHLAGRDMSAAGLLPGKIVVYDLIGSCGHCRPIRPRSRHLPRASTDGSSTANLNKNGVRLWTALPGVLEIDACLERIRSHHGVTEDLFRLAKGRMDGRSYRHTRRESSRKRSSFRIGSNSASTSNQVINHDRSSNAFSSHSKASASPSPA